MVLKICAEPWLRSESGLPQEFDRCLFFLPSRSTPVKLLENAKVLASPKGGVQFSGLSLLLNPAVEALEEARAKYSSGIGFWIPGRF